MLIGVVGKPNTGKSTFFNAATLASVPVASYPFTTIEPNIGVAYVRIECVCRELGVEDNPKNSYCVEGKRFIPFKLVDTAGLVPEAWKGRGLGNQFLDKISRADLLIHVVDASGSTDLEGNPLPPGTHDPVEDILFLEEELARWFEGILARDWQRISRRLEMGKEAPHTLIHERLSGLNFTPSQIQEALEALEADRKKIMAWRVDERLQFARELLRIARPILIAANKIDMPSAKENLDRLRDIRPKTFPVSAVSELALRRASKAGYIRYLPGDPDFEILDREGMTGKQLDALEKIRERVLEPFKGTGVQEILNYAVFEELKQIAVFPVANHERLTDKDGNVLPDALLIPSGSTVKEFAEKIHTDLAKNILFAIDARSKMRISPSHPLKHRDIIQIVSAAR